MTICLHRLRTFRPNNHPDQDQRHGRQNHQPVVEVAGGVPAVGDDLVVPQRAGAEQLAEEGHHDKHESVAETVHHAVHERRERLVRQREGLQPAHDDAVGDDQAHEHRQHLAHIIEIRLQQQIHEDNEEGDHQQLHDDADAWRYRVSHQGDDEVGAGADHRHGEGHDHGGLELRGHRQRRADAQRLH